MFHVFLMMQKCCRSSLLLETGDSIGREHEGDVVDDAKAIQESPRQSHGQPFRRKQPTNNAVPDKNKRINWIDF